MITELYKQAIARKKEPKTGSYTTYLFDKGLDKILKKGILIEEQCQIVLLKMEN